MAVPSMSSTTWRYQGEKAPVEAARRMMPGVIPVGSAVRLGNPEGGKLLVTEGLESAISAGEIHNCPAWALINADRMRAWVPPQGINHVIIAGDNDKSFTGQYSAYCLAQRLVCQFKIPKVEVSIPMQLGVDWNDVWRRARARTHTPACNNS